MKGFIAAATLLLYGFFLASCDSDRITEPEESQISMQAWFAQSGILLPTNPPASEPSGKAASDDRLLGDVTQNGSITYWDLLRLFQHLIGRDMPKKYDFALADIDRDGDTDWDDLKYLGRFLYVEGSGNPWGIGHPYSLFDNSFDIELVFVDSAAFTEHQKRLIRKAADRWESVITEDLDDVDFQQRPFDWHRDGPGWGYFQDPIAVTDVVDDLRIFVGRLSEDDWAGGRAGSFAGVERPNGISPLAQMFFGHIVLFQAEDIYQWRLRNPNARILVDWTSEDVLVWLAMHEIGHCLGIGTGSPWASFLSDGFVGPQAIQAFKEAGGSGEKVPVEWNSGHWRRSVFDPVSAPQVFPTLARIKRDELMSPSGQGSLSAITIAALADMGYGVDFSQADFYRLPEPLPAGKRVAAGWTPPLCGVGHQH